MKKIIQTLAITTGLTLGMSAMAADQLHNTKWTTFNDDGKKESIIKFTDNNGVLSARIYKILDSRSSGKKVCDICKGKFKGKKLTGAKVIWGLKADAKNPNKYAGGEGIKPVSGVTFQGKAELKGDTLELRGYKGVSMFGQTKILKRYK